ncbi:hypothetical protein HELRODRAFT_114111 [Helobdella robusta]|uniref:Peroxisomal membrane protein PEX13 n=1 Tax=Helobdella robusta TaxID=6412 RepID=T1EFZ1_HELRO|nr:hypothetical protein HELRODRAFT_114111 [Helobdella robusta]ESN97686.1 hypothetical protein HELRODRAFT_114111 [Helobdella robusta]
MYGGYGGYGGFYNPQLAGDAMAGGFAQQAEVSTRQAFQSVETIVRAFGSIAMMLDSTYQAVFNSFRAIIGMADQISRMRLHLSHIFSTLALFRVLRWIVRKVKYFLRRLRLGGEVAFNEQLWEDSIRADGLKVIKDIGNSSGNPTWPIFLFFAIVTGGPWLLWKFFNSFAGNHNDKTADWLTGLSDSYVGVAEYDFQARTPDELSFKRGNKISIAPQELQTNKGWLLASVDKMKVGLVPMNFIKIIGKIRGKNTNPTTSQTSDSNANISDSTQANERHYSPIINEIIYENICKEKKVNDEQQSKVDFSLPIIDEMRECEKVATSSCSDQPASSQITPVKNDMQDVHFISEESDRCVKITENDVTNQTMDAVATVNMSADTNSGSDANKPSNADEVGLHASRVLTL